MKWRNDKGDECTANKTLDTKSWDLIKEDEGHYLKVGHVFGFHGRGFMCNISFGRNGCTTRTGNLFYGEDEYEYNRAVSEGRSILTEEVEEMREAMKKYS